MRETEYERHLQEMVDLGGMHECASDCPQPVPVRQERGPSTMTVNLDDLERLLEAATPGPWRAVWQHSDPEGDYPAGVKGNDGEPNNWVLRHDDDLGTDLDKNNDLIVAAVNSLPALIAAARRAEALESAARMAADAIDKAQEKAWDGEAVHRDLYDAAATLRAILAGEGAPR